MMKLKIIHREKDIFKQHNAKERTIDNLHIFACVNRACERACVCMIECVHACL